MAEVTKKLIVQRIAGRRIPKRFMLPSEFVDKFLPLLVGQVEVYDLATSGGSDTDVTPNPVRTMRFSVLKPNGVNGYIGCSFTVPHVKPSKSFNDLVPLMVGKFDAHWNSEVKASNVKLLYEKLLLSETT